MKVARTVLRRAALGNKCRLSDKSLYIAAKKEWGALLLPIVVFYRCWWCYFSVMASQPLGTVMVDTSLPSCRAAFTSILY
ncbi:hypothetical protein CMV05_05410 [Vibrio anguillarum]|nr:hypothetical protein CMV05_05410 [Vibrio anguillarum]